MQIKKQVAFRTGTYFVLHVKKQGKVIITIDGRDGFELTDLELIKSFQDGIHKDH